MVTLKVYSAPIPPAVKIEIKKLDTLCFPYHSGSTEGADRFCSGGDLIYYVCAMDDNQLIGETQIFKRAVVFNNQNIILGGIGSVATHPDKRRQGIATDMMKRAMYLLNKEKCDVAYLCTDVKNPKAIAFYEKFGFRRLLQKHTYTGRSGKRYTDTDGMLAQVVSKELFNQILTSHNPFDIGRGNW